MNPKISVIVPVYNVESFIAECLEGLVNQTLHDIEIILVDDGSTDSSGSLCENLALGDERIRPFHTPNRGLGAARNFGVTKARAEFVMFVDSDDIVTKNFCAGPYQLLTRLDADICFFKLAGFDGDSSVIGEANNTSPTIPTGELNREEAMNLLFVEGVRDYAVTKLVRKTLFDSIHFPSVVGCEDMATSYRLVEAASRIVSLDETLYYYRRREGSLSLPVSWQSKRSNTVDGLSERLIRHRWFAHHHPEVLEKDYQTLYATAISYCACHGDCTDGPLFKEALDLLSSNSRPDGLNRKQNLVASVARSNRKAFVGLCKILYLLRRS